jgi:hypothetical protein
VVVFYFRIPPPVWLEENEESCRKPHSGSSTLGQGIADLYRLKPEKERNGEREREREREIR